LNETARAQVKSLLDTAVSGGKKTYPHVELMEKVKELKMLNLFAAQQLCEQFHQDSTLKPSPLQECELLFELTEVRLSIGPLSATLQLAQDLLKMSQTHCLGQLNNFHSIAT
jgi:hypothetical protein